MKESWKERGEAATIYALGESGEGPRPGALPDLGGAKPGRVDTLTQIT